LIKREKIEEKGYWASGGTKEKKLWVPKSKRPGAATPLTRGPAAIRPCRHRSHGGAITTPPPRSRIAVLEALPQARDADKSEGRRVTRNNVRQDAISRGINHQVGNNRAPEIIARSDSISELRLAFPSQCPLPRLEFRFVNDLRSTGAERKKLRFSLQLVFSGSIIRLCFP
jgi:hypothetical protein